MGKGHWGVHSDFVLKIALFPLPAAAKAANSKANSESIKATVLGNFLAKSRPELLECE